MSRAQLIYAFDAYCGWCYGFGPALRKFAADNADRIELHVLSAGLFSGPASGPVGAYPHIPGANDRIAELTGVTFGAPYRQVLAQGTMVMDSTAPAVGLVALHRQAPGRALEIAGAIQRAWYEDGLDLRELSTYQSIAADLSLDVGAATAAWAHPSTRAEAEEDFRTLRRLGISRYPTLLLRTGSGLERLGGPVSSAEALSTALTEHLDAVAERA